MIGVVHSNLYDLLGRWSWLVFGLGLAISIAHILALKWKIDWDIYSRLRAVRVSWILFLVFTVWRVGNSLTIAYSGPDPFNDVHIWKFDKMLAAGIALTFTLAFAVEEAYLRYKIKRMERELEAQLAGPSNAHPTP